MRVECELITVSKCGYLAFLRWPDGACTLREIRGAEVLEMLETAEPITRPAGDCRD